MKTACSMAILLAALSLAAVARGAVLQWDTLTGVFNQGTGRHGRLA